MPSYEDGTFGVYMLNFSLIISSSENFPERKFEIQINMAHTYNQTQF